MADASAREGLSNSPPTILDQLAFDAAKKLIKQETTNAMNHYWEQEAPERYRRFRVDSFTRNPRELALIRKHLSRLYAARSTHGDFAAYHNRFNHDNAHLCCGCGQLKAPTHFLDCSLSKIRPPRAPPPNGDPEKYLLGTWEGALRFTKWLDRLEFFTKICPRNPS